MYLGRKTKNWSSVILTSDGTLTHLSVTFSSLEA
jgi:hypothetical protein